MVQRDRVGLRTRAVLAGAAVLVCQSLSMGGSKLDSSAITFRFDPDTNGGSDLKTLDLSAPASSAMPAPPNYQFSKTFASGNSNSTAKGSIGYVANQTTASFTLAPGTGVTQSDPGNAVYKGDSLFRISFDGLFSATSPSFGPLASGYVSVAVGGVVGTGGSAKFTGQVNFLNTDGTQLRPTVNFDQAFTTAGSFAKTFTSSSGLNPITLATNTQFRVKGFFEFRASNHGRPSSITPLDVEVGSAPPTATWNVNSNGLWANPSNWAAPAGSFVEDLGLYPDMDGGDETIFFAANSLNSNFSNSIYNPPAFAPSIPVVPNGVGQRARFTSTLGGSHTITLGGNVTLGALDFGNNGNLNFTSPSASFILDTSNQGNASVQARNTGVTRTNKINVPLILRQDLDIDSDGNYIPGNTENSPRSNLYFAKRISGEKAVNKNGNGNAYFNAANTYTGGSNINGGQLFANIAGALGTGNVFVDNAQLNYNARNAAGPNAYVSAYNGGQIDLGVTPGSNEEFNVSGLSAVSGNAAALGSITAVESYGEESYFTNGSSNSQHSYNHHPGNYSGATLYVGYGAMIGHETFDTGKKGNPKDLGNDPRYVFGISADFDKPSSARSITIGSDSDGPWVGFGSDRTERTFGSNPQYSADQIKVKGAGSLVALNETLWLNAKLVSVGTNASLDKYGKGVVAIQNKYNNFKGPINVYEGGLLVNGRLPGLTSLDAWYGTSLGGKGEIGGPVHIHDGASIDPGSIEPNRRAGTLSVDDLTLDEGAALNFDLDRPSFLPGCDINDLIDVDGDLFLAGTLNINDLGDFGTGVYTLIHFEGDLTGPGLSLGILPTSEFTYSVSVVGENVKLSVSALPTPLVAVTAQLVPEPGVVSMLIAAASAGLLARRRRQA